MAQVFISYNKRDRALAVRVAAALREEGLSIWWDDEVTPREQWDRTLEREIGSADKVLVLWSRSSVESDWVRIEANFARNCRPSKLVQARFDHCTIPIAFSLIQYVDLDWDRFDEGEGWRKLLWWLREGQPEEPLATIGPDPPAAEACEVSPPQPPPKNSRLFNKFAALAAACLALLLLSGPAIEVVSDYRLERRKSQLSEEFRGRLAEVRTGYDLPADLKAEAESLLNRVYTLAQIEDRYVGPLHVRRAEFELSGPRHQFGFRLAENKLVDRCYEEAGIEVSPLHKDVPFRQWRNIRKQHYRGRICLAR